MDEASSSDTKVVTWIAFIGSGLTIAVDKCFDDGDLKKWLIYGIPLISSVIYKIVKWLLIKIRDSFDKEKRKEKELKKLYSLQEYTNSALEEEHNKPQKDMERILFLQKGLIKTDELIFQKIAE